MLGNIVNAETRGFLSAVEQSSALVCSRSEGNPLVASTNLAKTLLKPVLTLLDSGQMGVTDPQEVRLLCGIRQQLLSLRIERCDKILSQSLFSLAMDYVHHPTFSPVAQAILQALKDAPLSHAQQAAHQLDLLGGEGGSFFEYCQQSVHRLAYAQNYAPLALALVSTGLMGRSAGLLLKRVGVGTRLTGLGLELSTGALKLSMESMTFPLNNALAHRVFGQSMGVQDYWVEVWQGAQLMMGLHWGARLGRMAKKIKSLGSAIPSVLPLGMEYGALSVVGYFNGQGDLSFYMAESLGTMLHLRGAQGLNAILFPGLSSVIRRVDLAGDQMTRGASRILLKPGHLSLIHRRNPSNNLTKPALAWGSAGVFVPISGSYPYLPMRSTPRGPGADSQSWTNGRQMGEGPSKKLRPLSTVPNLKPPPHPDPRLAHQAKLFDYLAYFRKRADAIGPEWRFNFNCADICLDEVNLRIYLTNFKYWDSSSRLPQEYAPGQAVRKMGVQFNGKNELGENILIKGVGDPKKLWLILRLQSTQNPQIERFVLARFKNLFSELQMAASNVQGREAGAPIAKLFQGEGVGWELSLKIPKLRNPDDFTDLSFFIRDTHPDYLLKGVRFLDLGSRSPLDPGPKGPPPGIRMPVLAA